MPARCCTPTGSCVLAVAHLLAGAAMHAHVAGVAGTARRPEQVNAPWRATLPPCWPASACNEATQTTTPTQPPPGSRSRSSSSTAAPVTQDPNRDPEDDLPTGSTGYAWDLGGTVWKVVAYHTRCANAILLPPSDRHGCGAWVVGHPELCNPAFMVRSEDAPDSSYCACLPRGQSCSARGNRLTTVWKRQVWQPKYPMKHCTNAEQPVSLGFHANPQLCGDAIVRNPRCGNGYMQREGGDTGVCKCVPPQRKCTLRRIAHVPSTPAGVETDRLALAEATVWVRLDAVSVSIAFVQALPAGSLRAPNPATVNGYVYPPQSHPLDKEVDLVRDSKEPFAYHELEFSDAFLVDGAGLSVDVAIANTAGKHGSEEGGAGIIFGDLVLAVENTKKSLQVVVRRRNQAGVVTDQCRRGCLTSFNDIPLEHGTYEASAQGCQRRCQRTKLCAAFEYVPPATRPAPATRSGGGGGATPTLHAARGVLRPLRPPGVWTAAMHA